MLKRKKTLQAEEIKRLVGVSPLLIEVGCHDGSDTAAFLQEMPQATIYCFEPDERAAQRFIERFENEERVTFYPEAVADIDGPHDFYPSTGIMRKGYDWDLSGSLHEPTGHLTRSPEIKFKDPVKCNCCRLDTWFADHTEHSFIDFIWADIQGSQCDFIRGADHVLIYTKYLYIEAHNPPAYKQEPTQEELIDLLDPMFKPLGFYGENILFQNRGIE